MSQSSQISTEFWEREVAVLNQISAIRADIELEVESGRAEIRYLLDRQIELERLNETLLQIRKDREIADSGESDTPTIRPHGDRFDEEFALDEPLNLHSGK